MGLVLRRIFDWQEDLIAFWDSKEYDQFMKEIRGMSGKYRISLKLSIKGKLRKLFRRRK